jgi:DNA-binding PadR family transcriptional regulator
MMASAKLSYTAALILQTISAGYNYGFDIMDVAGLASGTVYPALRRLEQQGLIKSNWERGRAASAEQRPPRRYYGLTPQGKDALAKVLPRYRLLEQLSNSESSRPS